MKTQKKEWKNIAKWWAASGVIEKQPKSKYHKEMSAFINGLLKGLFIGMIIGGLVVAIFMGG